MNMTFSRFKQSLEGSEGTLSELPWQENPASSPRDPHLGWISDGSDEQLYDARLPIADDASDDEASLPFFRSQNGIHLKTRRKAR